MPALNKEKGVTLLKEKTTFGGILKYVQRMKKPPETPIEIVITELQQKTSKKTKKVSVIDDDPFQAILNIKPSKGIRSAVEVLREIRDTE